jgi:hypothetical protein
MKNRILSQGMSSAFARGAVSAALLMGCGSSEPTDDTTAATDATVDATVEQSPPDAGATSENSTDSGFDFVGALPDGSLRDCAVCIRDQCATLFTECFNDNACRQGVTCTIASCLPRSAAMGDGGIDLGCISTCFMGNLLAGASAYGGIMCVSTTCGATCSPAADAGNPAVESGSDTGDAGSNLADGESNTPDAASE